VLESQVGNTGLKLLAIAVIIVGGITPDNVITTNKELIND
jgi:hypothetical protein